MSRNIFYSCPFMFMFMFLAAGVLVGTSFVFPVFFSATMIGVFFILSIFLHHRREIFIMGLCVSLFFIGQFRANCIEADYRKAAEIISFGKKYEILGEVISFPKMKKVNKFSRDGYKYKTSFVTAVSEVKEKDKLKNFKGNVQVFLYTEQVPDLFRGDRVKLHTALNRSFTTSNPHQFSYSNYLKNREIYLVAYIKDENDINLLERENNLLYRILNESREQAARFITENIDNYKARAFLLAVIVGNRELLTLEMRDNFLKTGTVHVLAVSGLHIGIITMIIFVLLKLFFKQRKYIYGISIVIISLYAVVVGLRPSVLRALIMVSVFIFSRILGRQNSLLNSLFIAAVLVVLVHPYDLYSAGFLFSFTIVFFLITLTPLIGRSLIRESIVEDRYRQVKQKVVFFLSGCLVAQLAVIPIMLYYSNIFSVSSFFINIVLIPLMYPVLFTGFVFVVLGMLLPFLIPVLKPVTVFFSLLLINITDTVAASKSLYFHVAAFSFWGLVVYYTGLIFLLKKSLRKAGLFLIFAAITYVAVNHYLTLNRFKVSFLSVGHGEVTFINIPDNENALIDAGSMTFSDGGVSIISAFLKGEGVNRIDNLFVSHLHRDHYSAIFELTKNFDIKKIFLPDLGSNNYVSQNLLYAINALDADVVFLNTSTELPDSVKMFSVLSPPPDHISADNKYLYLNENSLVLLFSYKDIKGLFTGDIEKNGIQFLLSQPSIDIDFLKVPHHGGCDSYDPRFYMHYRPEIAVLFRDEKIKCQKLKDTFKKIDCTSFNTATDGSVSILKDKVGYSISAYKRSKKKTIKKPLIQKA